MHQTVNLAGLPFGGSNPSAPTLIVCGSSTMVVLQPSKLFTRVRFPSPAFKRKLIELLIVLRCCRGGSVVEHLLGKEVAAGSIPALG